jgi:hypothetical protein
LSIFSFSSSSYLKLRYNFDDATPYFESLPLSKARVMIAKIAVRINEQSEKEKAV